MGKRVDFTTTEERIAWLKSTAAKQEISVSQLLNRLIRNRMKNEDRFINKKQPTNNDIYDTRKWGCGQIQYIPEGCTFDGIYITKEDGTYMSHEEWMES